MNKKTEQTHCEQREGDRSSQQSASGCSESGSGLDINSHGRDNTSERNPDSANIKNTPESTSVGFAAPVEKNKVAAADEAMNIPKGKTPEKVRPGTKIMPGNTEPSAVGKVPELEPGQITETDNIPAGETGRPKIPPAEDIPSIPETPVVENKGNDSVAETAGPAGESAPDNTQNDNVSPDVIDPAIYGLGDNAVLTDTLKNPASQEETAEDSVPLDNIPGRPVFGDPDFYKETTFFPVVPRQSCSIEEITEWMQSHDIQFGLDYVFGGERRFISAESSEKIWFVADLHGDYYSFQKIIDHIAMNDPDASIVFMGDLFDRGTKNLETVKAVLELIKYRPGKIVWLAGNHDTALYFSEETKQFASRVSGHNPLFEDLNRLNDPVYEAFGKALIGFIAKLPHAIFFADGIIVSHGGIPLQDTLENITTMDDFNSDAARYDFCWVRPEDKAQRQPSNPAYINTEKDRTSTAWYKQQRQNPDPSGPVMFKSCWTAFEAKLQKIARIKPYCLLAGHQHPGKGVDFARKHYPCIFLNSNLKTVASSNNSKIAFARGREHGTPEVIVLTVDRTDYDSFYGNTQSVDVKQ